MYHAYTQMQPDSSSSRLAVASSHDSGASGLRLSSASSRTKRPGIQNVRRTPTQLTLPQPPPPSRRTGARQQHPAGRSLHLPPALGARAWAGAARGVLERLVIKRLPRPTAGKLVCLNLNRHDIRWQQLVPAYRPASLANQKLQPKEYISVYHCLYIRCTYHVYTCIYIYRNVYC
jgi:hypothetical protein